MYNKCLFPLRLKKYAFYYKKTFIKLENIAG